MNTLPLTRGRVAAFYAAVVGAGLVVVSSADVWPLRVVYNASASVPIGWYGVAEAEPVDVGDLVIARPPIRAEILLAERGYLAAGVPILKFVAARAGQRVCRTGEVVTIDDLEVATARDRDGAGRALPRWNGCRELGEGEVFLLNTAAPDSFDGRYFGPVSINSIIGKATPLWTW